MVDEATETLTSMIRSLVVAFGCAAFMAPSLLSGPSDLATQMVLVVAKDWSTTEATLYRLERVSPEKPWRTVGKPMRATLGRTGLAWDEEVGQAAEPHAFKQEGDGKSPAGIFHIEAIYGTVPSNSSSVKKLRLPYRQITADLECVDDVKSVQYNRMVERSRVPAPDWNSSEKIRSLSDSVYRWLAVVDYNQNGAHRGAGSCIFLHVADADGQPTAGCTALKLADLLELFRWIDPRKSPVIVQAAVEGLDALIRSQPRLLQRLPSLPE
jgi:L,D-peptidoglycan transpeptidase YkuD (ErfK/YbiS/YcfS/YnhG family)